MTGCCVGRAITSLCARSRPQRPEAVGIEMVMSEKLWLCALDGRMPFDNVLVAIANRHARQMWAVPAPAVDSDPHARPQHPMHQQHHAA